MYTLITGASSARAYQLKKQQEGQVLLGDYAELPAIMINAGTMVQLPVPQSPSYAHQMLTLCLDKQVERILILHHTEEALLREAELLFAEYGIQLYYCADEL